MSFSNLQPKVSVVMPVFNGAIYLGEAIESILNQTYRDFEFIVVDDCSTDHSLEIVRSYAIRDVRIRIIENQENLGISGATNRGIENALGLFIALMDQDDISLPERFEKEVNFLEKHSSIAAVSGNSITIKQDGEYRVRPPVFETPGLIRWGLLFRNQIQNSAAMIRRSVIFKHAIRYESFSPAQDYRFWVQLCHKEKIANLAEPLLYHRLHNLNASDILQNNFYNSTYKIRKDLVYKCLNWKISDSMINGLLSPEKITNIGDANQIIKLILAWQRWNRNIGFSKFEKKFITRKTSQMISNIWHFQHKPIILLPYLLYSRIMIFF